MMRYPAPCSRRRNNPAPLRVEPLESRQLLATLTVNSTADASPPADVLTLREAILLVDGGISLSSLSSQAQAQVTGSLSDPNTIAFDIPGQGVHTITPSSLLPVISAPVTIDGYTQPGASPNTLAVGDNAVLLIELDGANIGAGGWDFGLVLGGGDSTVEGLVVNRFNNVGIQVNDSGGDRIEGNFIGSDPTGTIDRGNGAWGIFILSGANDTIGGTEAATRNIVSANKSANIQIGGAGKTLSGVVIQGNYVGTDTTGTKSLIIPSRYSSNGIVLRDTIGAVIGGTVAGAGNVISGNPGEALTVLWGAASVSDALIQGNFIGTNAIGTAAVPSSLGGISVQTSGNTIGGTTPGARNIIAANATFDGLVIVGSNNLIEGNLIGTGANGTESMGNGTGMVVQYGTGNTIGGSAAGAGNVIANSLHQGIVLEWGAANNLVLSNSITNNTGGGITDLTENGGNAPAIELAVAGPTSTHIFGSLDNTPNSTFTIQFFTDTALDAAGQAEGQRYLGSAEVTTGASDRANIDAILAVAISPGEWVTATASASGQNTTVFSAGIQAKIASTTTAEVEPVVSPGGRVYGFTLTATVANTQTSTEPTGSITFKDGTTVLGAVQLNAAGQASLTTGILPAGTHSFTANYSGDGTFTTSVSDVSHAVSQDVPPTLVAAQRGPVRGPSTVTLTFSDPMSFTSLHNVANYQVVPLRTLRNGRTVFGRPVRVRSAQVSASTESVTLVLAQRLSPGVSYQLTVLGTPPGGVANAGGTFLNGNGSGVPGTNAMVVLPPVVRSGKPRARHR